MKKYLISTILFLAIIATTSVVYYFATFLPKQNLLKQEREHQTFLFNKQTECRNICEKLHQQTIIDFPEKEGYTVLNPKYFYNEIKNACFYSEGVIYFDKQGTHQSEWIYNCQTNESMAFYSKIGKEEMSITKAEYDMLLKEYVGK